MKKGFATNLLDRVVTIDYPGQWKMAPVRNREELKANLKAHKPYFGRDGRIVAVVPVDETLKLTVESQGELLSVYQGDVTIHGLPL